MPLQQLENLYDKYCSAYNSGNVKQLFFEGTTLRQPMITRIRDSRGTSNGVPVKMSRQVHVSRRSPTGRQFGS